MKLPSDKFCVLPWVSLEASPIGTVRPCCLAEDELRDHAGDKFNLATAEFSTIQTSPGMRRLRQQFINGEQPETCRKCWNEERAGRTSKRMHTLARLEHMLPEQDWTPDAKPLMFLDLKLGNICNLKCRICGSWSSSTFATEELQYVTDKKASFHYQMLRQGAWPRSNPQFWSQIDSVIDHIQYIEFTGGEPFMIQEHFDLLQRLVDSGHASQIEIHYNTNATHFPTQAPDIWSHFRLVEIAFSIDDVNERFEYQRSGARWTVAQNTIQEFFTLKRQRKNFRLQICATVNAFNVLYLEHLADWIDSKEFDFVYWNIQHEAAHFCIANLPDTVKQIAKDRLLNATVSDRTQEEFGRIVDFMNAGTEDLSESLRKEIRKVDIRRGEDLSRVAPELAQLLNYTKELE
jgi:MoaA/NifB/PqqE/SkfB family radical SAM enzyme